MVPLYLLSLFSKRHMQTLSSPRRSRRTAAGLALVTGSLAAGACSFPTDAPILEQRWNVPVQSTTIGVAELLPGNVSVSGNAFTITVAAPAPITRTLYQDCPACAAANGATIPKPAFTASTATTTSVPSDIAGATLTGGLLTIQVRNGYAFDPLRPAAGANGSLTVRVTNGSTTLGATTVSGATHSLAPGATLGITVPLSGAITGAQPVTVTVEVSSPAGDPVTMTANQSITVTPSITGLTVASAQVRVNARRVTTETELDLSDIDEELADAVDSAWVRLSITNPFAVSGTLAVTFEAPGEQSLTRDVQLVASTTANEQVVRLSGDELRRFIGHEVTLTIAGDVSATAPVTVTPAQAVAVASRLDLFVSLGR